MPITKPVLKSLIFLLSNASLNMLMGLWGMGFGILLILQLILLVFLMPTVLGVLMIGRVHPGGVFYLGYNLVCWHSKKQTALFLSTAEAEYITAGSYCAQMLWMKQMLHDFGIEQNTLTLFCDNTSAINISKNPVQHSCTKHIDIRQHFIRELVEEGLVVHEHVPTEHQKVDIFTKPIDLLRFEFLRKTLGVVLSN